jgi:hypothetical protein
MKKIEYHHSYNILPVVRDEEHLEFLEIRRGYRKKKNFITKILEIL